MALWAPRISRRLSSYGLAGPEDIVTPIYLWPGGLRGYRVAYLVMAWWATKISRRLSIYGLVGPEDIATPAFAPAVLCTIHFLPS